VHRVWSGRDRCDPEEQLFCNDCALVHSGQYAQWRRGQLHFLYCEGQHVHIDTYHQSDDALGVFILAHLVGTDSHIHILRSSPAKIWLNQTFWNTLCSKFMNSLKLKVGQIIGGVQIICLVDISMYIWRDTDNWWCWVDGWTWWS